MKEIFKFFLTRGLWLSFLMFSLILIGLDIRFRFFVITDCFAAGLTITGLILTIVVFFQSIGKDTTFMKNVYKYGKDKEFIGLCSVSLIFSFIASVLGLIANNVVKCIAFYFLVASLFELLGVIISILAIVKINNTKNKN